MSSDRSRGRVQPLETRLEGIAEAARRAGVLIDPDGHDWGPDVIVRAHGGAWLISPWSSGSPRGWCAQQMVKVGLAWLRIPDSRAWLGADELEPQRILGRLLGAVELPRQPVGQATVSTRRVPDAEIRRRLAWLRSPGLKMAKAHRDEGSVLAIASLAASIGSAAARSKQVGARAAAAGGRALAQAAQRLWDHLRTRDRGQSLRIVPQPGIPSIPSGGVQRPSRLDARDGEGLLEWDAAAKRWRLSNPDTESPSAQIPRIRVPAPLPNGGTDSAPRALSSSVED